MRGGTRNGIMALPCEAGVKAALAVPQPVPYPRIFAGKWQEAQLSLGTLYSGTMSFDPIVETCRLQHP
jgi:hypothetical protein